VQATLITALAERKLVDLFDVAEATAIANGRGRILRRDLPLTKDLKRELAQAETLAADVELRPLLVFLDEAGVGGPLDEVMRGQIPRLMAAANPRPRRVRPTRPCIVASPDWPGGRGDEST
jgi:hypothetical protein